MRTLVPMKRPSSEPLPLVFAVATTVNPGAGLTYLPIFFRKTPLPSRTDCRHRILFDARSISSRRSTAPRSRASMTGPLCQTVLPSTKRKPPIRSSSSVSMVILTRINSLFSWAQDCSTPMVLPFPDRPVMKTGKNERDPMMFFRSLKLPN